MTGSRRPSRMSQFLPAPGLADPEGLAASLAALRDKLEAYDPTSIVAIAFKKPPENSLSRQFQLLGRWPSTTDVDDIIDTLKARYGGGEYRITFMGDGKLVGHHEFAIFGEPITPGAATKPANDAFGGGDFFKLMMMQQSEASNRQLELTRLENERRDRAAERQTALIGTVLAGAMPALLPLLLGSNREKLSDIVALMQNNKGGKGDLKEMVEILVLLKGLTGDGEKPPGWDPENVMGSIMAALPNLAGAAGRAFGGAARGAPGDGGEAPPASEGQLYLEAPTPAAPAPLPPPVLPAAEADRDPLVKFLTPHVMYFFRAPGTYTSPDGKRRQDPGLAAEAIADMMAAEGVTEADLAGLVTAFSLSSDWQADLARQGIDLREDPQWAEHFRAELVDAWSSREQGDDGRGGSDGRPPDVARDEEAGAGGLDLAIDPAAGA